MLCVHLVGLVKENKLINMHRLSSFKIVAAEQTWLVYNYKTTKQKLFKTNAAMIQ